MKRRAVLSGLAALPFAGVLPASPSRSGMRIRPRVRPQDPQWPTPAECAALNGRISGRLIRVRSPLSGCGRGATDRACPYAIKSLHDPYYLRDEPGLTQLSGYADAWVSRPSAPAVRARSAADVAAAVGFARHHRRLPVIKGAGHGSQGTSDAPDSPRIWTRDMDRITIEESFVPVGRAGERPQPAVDIGAGAVWMDAYHAVTTVAGRYVQGGGCATVGVAGRVRSGGFSSFSKHFGTCATGLLQAEVVTADGRIRRVNAHRDAHLFWALKGGGGTFGVVTRVWLRVRELPDQFGAVFATLQAHSDAAFRRLIDRFTRLCRESLINPHWGETVTFHRDRRLTLSLVSNGLTRARMEALWRPLFAWVRAAPKDLQLHPSLLGPSLIGTMPARHGWDARCWQREWPGTMTSDPRPDAPTYSARWTGDGAQAGQFRHAYASLWLPRALLDESQRERLAGAWFDASRPWNVTLHFNKGLAGAPSETVAAISRSIGILRRIVPGGGSYVSVSAYFQARWQHAFWGAHDPRWLAAKMKYDPTGLFSFITVWAANTGARTGSPPSASVERPEPTGSSADAFSDPVTADPGFRSGHPPGAPGFSRGSARARSARGTRPLHRPVWRRLCGARGVDHRGRSDRGDRPARPLRRRGACSVGVGGDLGRTLT